MWVAWRPVLLHCSQPVRGGAARRSAASWAQADPGPAFCSQMLAEEVDCPAGRIINASSTTHRMKAMTSVVEGVKEPLASKPRVSGGAAAAAAEWHSGHQH